MDKHADDRERKWRKKRYGMRVRGRNIHVILRVWEKRSKDASNKGSGTKSTEG